jgi:hypothetical protein
MEIGFIPSILNIRHATNKCLHNRYTGDFHGQAPVLWTATALLR